MNHDLILALKDAYPHMTTEKARALIDQIGPAAAQALLRMTTKAEKSATISYKGATMNKPIPQHMEAAYDYCDLIDEIASGGAVGRSWAKTFVSTAIAQAAKLYPKAAQKTLGDALVASYKADAKPIVTMKAASSNPRPLVSHALSLMEGLGDKMDSQAFELLMRPITQQLEDAQRAMDQGTMQASHAAAATGKTTKQAPKMIPFEQLLVGNAAGLGADAQAIGSHYAARLRGAK